MTGKDVLESHGKTVKSLVDYLMKPIESPLGSGHINNHMNPVIGYQIEFFERNGFDFGDDMIAHSDSFRQTVNNYLFPEQEDVWYGSPNFTGRKLSDEELRLIGIDVRNFIRQKFGLPLLTQAEADGWVMRYELRDVLAEPLSRKRIPGGVSLVAGHISKEGAQRVMRCFEERFPDCYRLYIAMRDLAKLQGYDGITGYEFNWISQAPYRRAMQQCIEICLGPEMKANESISAYEIEDFLLGGRSK